MIEVAGKQVFTELAEIVDPSHTALLIVDMQRDFCCAGGSFDQPRRGPVHVPAGHRAHRRS